MAKTPWRADFIFSVSLLIRNLSCRKPHWYQWSEYGGYKLTYRRTCLEFLGFQKPFWIWWFPLSVYQGLEVSRATPCDCVVHACVGGWYPCLCISVLSHSSLNGRVLLWGCIRMNVYPLHKGHGQCPGTWESRQSFQAAAWSILPPGFAPLWPRCSVEDRHDPNRSLLYKTGWAVRYLWLG